MLEKPEIPGEVMPQSEMNNGLLQGIVLDNVANQARQGSGFNPLHFTGSPEASLFNETAVGLNFEHIFNGAAADKALAMFTPRQDKVEMYVQDERTATLYWPAEDSSWGMECLQTYTLPEGISAVDIDFSATPTEDRFPMGWAGFMWASYMKDTVDRRLHFYGRDGSKEGWMTFGEELYGNIEVGAVGYSETWPLPYQNGSEALNIVQHTSKRFIKPFYYGLMQQSHPDDPEVPMAFVMMFDNPEVIRFAMWNFYQDANGTPDTTRPAWDWHFIIRDPKPGETYSYKARMLLMPFHGPESVDAEYEKWLNGLDNE